MCDFVTPDGGHGSRQDAERVASEGRMKTTTDLTLSLHERAALIAKSTDPNVSIQRAIATYKLAKRKRLTEASQRGYEAILDDFQKMHTGLLLADFDSANGTALVEHHMAERYGNLSERSYNKALTVLTGLFGWYCDRGTISRNPAKPIEKAKERPVHRRVFSEIEVAQILAANQSPRDQIALRLLLFFGIRKGALRGIRFEHFDHERRELTIFTKGKKIQVLQIVDDTIWRLLDELREPGRHYLLPKRVTRKRTPPTRDALNKIAVALEEAGAGIGEASKDAQCAVELASVLDSLMIAQARFGVAVDSASTRVRLELAEPVGEHGLHLLWYRWLARAGVVEKGSTAGRRIHWSRHSAIQRIVDKTGDLGLARDVAGHSSVSVTEGYTRPSPERQAESMRKVLA